MIDLITAIKQIKTFDFITQYDSSEYELLIKQLGLNLENINKLPQSWKPFVKEWEPYCNYGLRVWQEPTQFAELLCFLHSYLQTNNIQSYLEIGSRHGGTFIWLDSMLRAFNPSLDAYAVDIAIQGNPLKLYQQQTPNNYFFKADSLDPALWTKLPTNIDMILIDGNHDYEYVLTDYYNSLYKKPKLILFHDTNNITCPGVVKLWKEIIANKTQNVDYYEFITNECLYFGLGVYLLKWN